MTENTPAKSNNAPPLACVDRFISQSTREMTFNAIEGYEILDANASRVLSLSDGPVSHPKDDLLLAQLLADNSHFQSPKRIFTPEEQAVINKALVPCMCSICQFYRGTGDSTNAPTK